MTDIKFSNKAGVDSFLVLTGVTSEENLQEYLVKENAGVPTYIGRDLDFSN